MSGPEVVWKRQLKNSAKGANGTKGQVKTERWARKKVHKKGEEKNRKFISQIEIAPMNYENWILYQKVEEGSQTATRGKLNELFVMEENIRI